ncbi:MAG: redoxin domain-containing protein [Chloroflexota bacterium]|nr:redoxin domain-containing protein [Chloroflexota bacterium]
MENDTPQTVWRRRRVPRLLAVPVLGLAALAFIYVVTRPLGGEPQPSFFVIGSVVPGVQIGQIAPGMAQAPASPRLALNGPDGSSVDLRDLAGKPVWILFWKTACQPCEAEAPAVAAAYAAHRGEGLVLLGVDVWDSAAVVQDYMAAHTLPYPIAIDRTGSFMKAYGLWGAPTHYFIGSDGIIRDRFFGPMPRDMIEESMRRIIPS